MSLKRKSAAPQVSLLSWTASALCSGSLPGFTEQDILLSVSQHNSIAEFCLSLLCSRKVRCCFACRSTRRAWPS